MDYQTFSLHVQIFYSNNPNFIGSLAAFSQDTYAKMHINPPILPGTSSVIGISGEWVYPNDDRKSLVEKVLSDPEVNAVYASHEDLGRILCSLGKVERKEKQPFKLHIKDRSYFII